MSRKNEPACGAVREFNATCESDRGCERPRLLGLLADMLAMLERLEWEGDCAVPTCPCCWMSKSREHKPDCELDALIQRGKE